MKHTNSILDKQIGFTLIEAAMSLVIVSVLFLGVTAIIANFTNTQRLNEAHSTVNRLSQILRDRMNYESICTNAISKVPFAQASALTLDTALPISIDYAALKIGDPPSGVSSIAGGVELPEFGLKITKLVLMTPPPAMPVAHFNDLDGIGAPTDMYKVNLIMQTEAIVQRGSGESLTSSMAPRMVGTMYLGVTNGNIRKCMNTLYDVVKGCAAQGMIYAPLGFNQPKYNMEVTPGYQPAAVENGCVPYQAFVGEKGAQGPQGKKGIDGIGGQVGPQGFPGGQGGGGNQGAQGPPNYYDVPVPTLVPIPVFVPMPPPAVPVPVPVPPSSPKWSDQRLKEIIGEFLSVRDNQP